MGAVPGHSIGRAGEGKRFLPGRALILACATVVVGVATIGIATSPAQAAARRHHDSLSGVSCVGSSYCVAVGSYQHAGVAYTLAERWNGLSWSYTRTPNPRSAYLSGVSCIAVGNCWATVNADSEPSFDHLVGSAWQGIGGAGAGLGTLYGVSCVATACSAGGTLYSGMGEFSAITEQSNGPGTWSLSGSYPSSETSPLNALVGVSCTSAIDCVAVGYTEYWTLPGPTLQAEPLIGTWDGSTWVIAPIAGALSGLSGVSCDGPSDCMAVGTTDHFGGGSGLIEHWDGSSWSVVSTPPLPVLNAVSCVSPSDCTAVGAGSEIARWNGVAWSVVSNPIPRRSTSSVLTGVSCTSTSNCLAVGDFVKNSTAQVNLAEHWNGTAWSIVHTPNR